MGLSFDADQRKTGLRAPESHRESDESECRIGFLKLRFADSMLQIHDSRLQIPDRLSDYFYPARLIAVAFDCDADDFIWKIDLL